MVSSIEAQYILPLERFETGLPFSSYLGDLPAHQPDYPALYAGTRLSDADIATFRDAGVSKVLIFTESWCPDSLYTMPLLARLAEALPDADFRVWFRDANIDFVNDVVCTRPPVPYVVFMDSDMRLIGRFVERPEALTNWLNEESRHFRTRFRLEQKQRVAEITWQGLLQSIAPLDASAAADFTQSTNNEKTLTVWEIWERKPEATTEQLHDVIRRHLPRVSKVNGMLSVEFSQLRDDPNRYMALFRYRDESYRGGFLASDAIREMRKELDVLWHRVTESTWSYEITA